MHYHELLKHLPAAGRPIKKSYCSHFNKPHMCIDKGYDYPDVREIVREQSYTAYRWPCPQSKKILYYKINCLLFTFNFLMAANDLTIIHENLRIIRRFSWIIVHIKSRCEEISEKAQIPGYRARRWVFERTHSWINRFRRPLVRWEKKAANYIALLHFAFVWITFRAAGLFG
jgi:transposase